MMTGEAKKKYILAVDDEPGDRELIAARLSAKGYRVVTSGSGKQAMELIREEKPAVVLVDTLMPGMDGIEVLKQVKAFDRHIPVAMVTAEWDDAEGRTCMELGAYDYVPKPLDFDYLETEVFLKLMPGE